MRHAPGWQPSLRPPPGPLQPRQRPCSAQWRLEPAGAARPHHPGCGWLPPPASDPGQLLGRMCSAWGAARQPTAPPGRAPGAWRCCGSRRAHLQPTAPPGRAPGAWRCCGSPRVRQPGWPPGGCLHQPRVELVARGSEGFRMISRLPLACYSLGLSAPLPALRGAGQVLDQSTKQASLLPGHSAAQQNFSRCSDT